MNNELSLIVTVTKINKPICFSGDIGTKQIALKTFGADEKDPDLPTRKRDSRWRSKPETETEMAPLKSLDPMVTDKYAEYSGITHYGVESDDDYDDVKESSF